LFLRMVPLLPSRSRGSVGVADVPAQTVEDGSPANAGKARFSPQWVAALDRIAWRDCPVEKTTEYLPLISGDAEAPEQSADTCNHSLDPDRPQAGGQFGCHIAGPQDMQPMSRNPEHHAR
jgi:hypothetical protein